MDMPFEQTIASAGQQPLVHSPTQDPTEIANRTTQLLPFVDNIKQMLSTPQGQMGAMLLARTMLSSRDPGEANGLMPRLVDGALAATSAMAQFNKNLSDSQTEDQKLAIAADRNAVDRRGQDVTARGQDVAASTAAAGEVAATERANIAAGAQDRSTAQRANESQKDYEARMAAVGAQNAATAANVDAKNKELQLERDKMESLATATTAKYNIDKDANTQALVGKLAKTASDASQLNGQSFERNFRTIWNAQAAATGKTPIQGPAADPQVAEKAADLVAGYVAKGGDAKAAAKALAQKYASEHQTVDVDENVMEQQILEALMRKQSGGQPGAQATPGTAPAAAPAAPAAPETADQEIARLQTELGVSPRSSGFKPNSRSKDYNKELRLQELLQARATPK